MLILLLTGCFLMDSDGPAVPTDAPPPPSPIDEVQAPVVAPVVAAPAVIIGEPDQGVQDMTNETLARQVASATATFNAASTVAELAVAYEYTLKVCDDLTTYGQDHEVRDFDYIASKGPGLVISWQAEGTVAVFVPTSEAWTAKAATTPGNEDDAYFAMSDYVYDNASAQGWSVWEMRNWDYGGCSGLGTGVVLESMKKLQAAAEAGDTFAARIAPVREAALRELTRTTESITFQRCDPNTLEPTADDKLQGEIQQILDTITLTDAERATLVDAKPKIHGEVFQGG